MSITTPNKTKPRDVSCLATEAHPWRTSPSYEGYTTCTAAKFEEISNVLLCQPQLNSSHLFRADILYDSSGVLQTPAEKEAAAANSIARDLHPEQLRSDDVANSMDQSAWSSPLSLSLLASMHLKLNRTVIRRLIPRKPKVDRALEQTCFMYREAGEADEVSEQRLVVYRPHVAVASEMPWYHPGAKALAFYYHNGLFGTSISIHFLPFGSEVTQPLQDRLHRTMLSLLTTLLRLTKHDQQAPTNGLQEKPKDSLHSTGVPMSDVDFSTVPLNASALKDTILPQHLVQNTYTRLKETYASDLISRWVESTEPSKHVFEDLSIAAFLIELWKQMYGDISGDFPGFIDVACGNGVLVYILLKEGYRGSGFDARRRKTWDVLDINDHLTEQLCIPKPFLDALDLSSPSASSTSTTDSDSYTLSKDVKIHNGIFPPSTFIISNHADELTPWTPILARLSSQDRADAQANPFLAIPCCSHALSGARHRYSLKDSLPSTNPHSPTTTATATANSRIVPTSTDPDAPQPRAGDLKALRAAKKSQSQSHVVAGDDKSMYGCLTRKVAALAQEVCVEHDSSSGSGSGSVELTLMRIPSTRNIGIVGNRFRQSRRDVRHHNHNEADGASSTRPIHLSDEGVEENMVEYNSSIVAENQKTKMGLTVTEIIERECRISGGVEAAARMWVERARKVLLPRSQEGGGGARGGTGGRGKVNEKRHEILHEKEREEEEHEHEHEQEPEQQQEYI